MENGSEVFQKQRIHRCFENRNRQCVENMERENKKGASFLKYASPEWDELPNTLETHDPELEYRKNDDDLTYCLYEKKTNRKVDVSKSTLVAFINPNCPEAKTWPEFLSSVAKKEIEDQPKRMFKLTSSTNKEAPSIQDLRLMVTNTTNKRSLWNVNEFTLKKD